MDVSSFSFSYIKTRLFSLVLLAGVCMFPLQVFAAVAYIAPDSGTYGRSFVVSVYVSSPTEAINAVAGTVTYPTEFLRATRVSKNGSIMGLWASEPTIHNGRISFEGVILNPGFVGSVGKILDITFEPLRGGEVDIALIQAQILANDGLATNVLTGTSGGTYVLSPSIIPPKPVSPPSPSLAELPGLPEVRSISHPDHTTWYSDSEAVFSWHLPEDVVDVSFSIDRLSAADPGNVSKGLIDTTSFSGLADGEWFFHLKFKNVKGWGQTAHLPFHIDTSVPTQLMVEEKEITSDHLAFSLKAEDVSSGVDHFQISLDGGTPFIWKDDGTGIVLFSHAGIIPHVVITAVDEAGNMSEPYSWTISTPQMPMSDLDSLLTVRSSVSSSASILLMIGGLVLVAFLCVIFLFHHYEVRLVKRVLPPRNYYKRSERAFARAIRRLKKDGKHAARHAKHPEEIEQGIEELEKHISAELQKQNDRTHT